MVEHTAFDRLIGTTLGNYVLEQLIEQSEAGPVFIARNNAAGTPFRLRLIVVPPNLTPENRIVYLGRLQQEANQVASLQHTNILPLVDYATHSLVGDSQGTPWPYLVSPYLPMNSLSAQLARKGPMDAILAGRYLDQIAAALEYAHQQAVLHRNLTTDCIFIRQDDNVLVADFGVIRMLEVGARFNTPETSKGVFGLNESSAPAPEQILGQAVDTYTDVYALGAELYRMLTGHRVYRGKTREEIIQQHLQAPIPSLTLWRSDLPGALDDVIARAMASEPAQRFRRPGELANAYHQIVAPQDTQRVPFFVAPASTISAQPQEVHSSAGSWDGGAHGGGKPPRQHPYITRDAGANRSMSAAPISRRRALTLIAAGGGVAAAVLAVAVFGRNYLAGNTPPVSTLPANTPLANTPLANTPLTNTPGTSSNKQILAHTSDIPLNNAKTFPISGHTNPGLLVHLPDGHFVAFDSTCTHAGCAVNYSQQDKLLVCPCHSAKFDPAKNAAVVQGPAQTPLASIKISVNADGTITQG
ncbi:MAG TPA: protein kinase [Ktedonobacteraceae bacterium]